MGKYLLLLWFIAVLFLQGCAQQNDIIPGKIYDHVSLKSDSSLSYAIYIPANSKVKHPPAFLFFDPHGHGDIPVMRYKELADRFGILLIGNNNSSNAAPMNTISSNLKLLLAELNSTFTIKEKDIAFWGFSGGAKAAMYNAGLNNGISYCIYGGSVINRQHDNIEQLGFNGKQDMNYTDLLGYAAQQKDNPRHLQIEFDGIHAWPDTTSAADAFRWLLLKKMMHKELVSDKAFIAQTVATYKKQISSLMQSNHYTDAYLTCNKSLKLLQSLTETSYFTSKKSFISTQPLFKKQLQDLQASLDIETSIKTKYQTDLITRDTLYWRKEIAELQILSNTDKSGTYSRLLGFLSLASYSYANRAFQTQDMSSLERLLFIYQHADPSNPEQAFMRAKLHVLKNEPEQARNALKEAILLGFDKKRIEADAVLNKL